MVRGDSVAFIESLKVKGGGVRLNHVTLVKKSALCMTTKKLIAKFTA
jgi:uncharacterized Zn ribbon protein